METERRDLRLILLDLDGTLIARSAWIPGVLPTLQRLMERGFRIRILTNTTLHTRRDIAVRFRSAGIDLPHTWVFTPAVAATAWIRHHAPQARVLALVHPRTREDFAGLNLTDAAPADLVLVGDMDDAWRVQDLNQALRCLLQGARLMALHRNRRWLAPDGYRMDAGAFVAALEYAAQVPCERVFGKPNPVFFAMALEDAGVPPDQALMVGDDPGQDIAGAKQCGIHAILVRPPEGRAAEPAAGAEPDGVLNHISELLTWIEADVHTS